MCATVLLVANYYAGYGKVFVSRTVHSIGKFAYFMRKPTEKPQP